ncbi:glycosyltransferase family 4 protein [Nitrosovibrio sp. Nv6]|uniref:glycosyltransferase family 4 protein n=1 Tax=Nitrosovibrio sp. Nv6 TaxID=1855340 RepID=UPI0018F427FB|nr:glycosyltransferase family 4 protein [Nitrosovibrio sp. Nv6]
MSHKICLVGHPYAPTGRGEDVRCTYRALRSAAMKPALRDIYGLIAPDTDELTEFSNACKDTPSDINIFHINGDEVDQSLDHLSYHRKWSGYNIVYPAWELERYPKEWAAQLDRFAEIWAPSRFIQEALESVCTQPVIHMPLACEILLSSFLSRRYFGIPESEYVFLFFFDVRSYSKRKNPQAVVEAFRRLLSLRPFAKTRLVLKINGAELAPQIVSQLRQELSNMIHHVTFLHRVMSDNEVKNLVRCCDCFVSLHRSEGFGRGIAEAMVFGKPVIATAFSGNMEFMNADVAFNVSYNLIPLLDGDYPYYQDQFWAEPNIDEASRYMAELIDDPQRGRDIGRKARLHMLMNFSYRQIGLRYRDRIENILQSR